MRVKHVLGALSLLAVAGVPGASGEVLDKSNQATPYRFIPKAGMYDGRPHLPAWDHGRGTRQRRRRRDERR